MMHTHAGPLVLSFAPHAPPPSRLAAWAERCNRFVLFFGKCFSLIFICCKILLFFFIYYFFLFVCCFYFGRFFISNLSSPTLFFFAFGGNQYGRSFFFSTLPSFNCFFCTLPVRGAVCFPPNCSTRTPTDTLVATALCASPAARMRRGRDERRAEGAVTCGRATRACGAEHTFLSLLFCFLCGQGGQTPAAPHTQPHPAALKRNFACFI
ncbi:ATPase [Trypanosoma cruzi]|uniref:ATPase n=1 Tax=Trypanosoma cruzi TaxID=5693 RepID=A0A7J6XIP2_TRYCR|nr:ATPase [Trypanosoma cruzi]